MSKDELKKLRKKLLDGEISEKLYNELRAEIIEGMVETDSDEELPSVESEIKVKNVFCPRCNNRLLSFGAGEIHCTDCGFDFEVDNSGEILHNVLCPKCKNHWIKTPSFFEEEYVECPLCGNSTKFRKIIYLREDQLEDGIDITLADNDIIITPCDCGNEILFRYHAHEKLKPGIIALFYWSHNEDTWWPWQMRYGEKDTIGKTCIPISGYFKEVLPEGESVFEFSYG